MLFVYDAAVQIRTVLTSLHICLLPPHAHTHPGWGGVRWRRPQRWSTEIKLKASVHTAAFTEPREGTRSSTLPSGFFRSNVGWHHQGHDLGHSQVWAAVDGPHQSCESPSDYSGNLLTISSRHVADALSVCRSACVCRWRWTCSGTEACPPRVQEGACLWCTTAPGCTHCLTATREEWKKVRALWHQSCLVSALIRLSNYTSN